MDRSKIIEISISSSTYPSEWKSLSDAPKTLYALGNVELLQTRKFTVVGSRRTPAAMIKHTETIAKEISQSFTIVTGTADGGDTAAIEGALSGSGKVICVLAGGFSSLPQGNIELLRRVYKKGLILSPHPYETGVRSFSYEYRNKLLAALGEGTLVVSAGEKSGALITAKYAESFQRPIFAFPYSPNAFAGVGCNRLLKKGGYLTENSVDILSRFGINFIEGSSLPELSEEESKLFSALQTLSEAHVSEISATSGIPLFKAKALLSALEVKGVVVALGGNRYTSL